MEEERKGGEKRGRESERETERVNIFHQFVHSTRCLQQPRLHHAKRGQKPPPKSAEVMGTQTFGPSPTVSHVQQQVPSTLMGITEHPELKHGYLSWDGNVTCDSLTTATPIHCDLTTKVENVDATTPFLLVLESFILVTIQALMGHWCKCCRWLNPLFHNANPKGTTSSISLR